MAIKFPSKDSKDKKERELANWIDEQRQAYKNGTLARERVRKLELIPGWRWVTSDDAPGGQVET